MRTEASSRFGLLSALLALALLLHQLWWNGFEVASLRFAVVVAALWVLLRPASVGRLLLLIGAEVVSVAREMPAVHSHTLLVLVVGSSVLALVALSTARARRLPEAGALFLRIAPFLRVAVLVLYAAAGIAKLNTGFLDPGLSCAAALSANVAWFDPSLLEGADWRVGPAIWATVAIELSLPVLLAVPRTRLVGLLLGVAFHTLLALAGNVPFSALAFALYVAFLPPGAVPRWFGEWRAPAPMLPGLIAGWLAAAALFAREPELGRVIILQGTRLALVVMAIGMTMTLLRARGRAFDGGLRLGHPILAVGIVVLVLNALSPYVGFKTESSFAMFSNLATEPGRWNHLLIPEAVRVLDYQAELVDVSASEDLLLRRRARGGRRLVRYELDRYLRRRPASRAAIAAAPAEASPITAVLDRVAKFRDVRPVGRPGC